jgi:hypothetical protein
MLQFAAYRFYSLSEELSRISSSVESHQSILLEEGMNMGEIEEQTLQLGLYSAHDQTKRIMQVTEKGSISPEILNSLFAELHRRVHDDLKRKLVYCVESDRNLFCDQKWLADTLLPDKFPTAFKELQAAGRCYAFGEGPASAFHSMRALEVALGVLAARFGVDFKNTNWHPVIEEIEGKIREISNAPKSQQRLDDEKFYGGLGRHFMFLKNGWRNHVMHVRENYTDREARQMLDHVTDLIMEMCHQLSE